MHSVLRLGERPDHGLDGISTRLLELLAFAQHRWTEDLRTIEVTPQRNVGAPGSLVGTEALMPVWTFWIPALTALLVAAGLLFLVPARLGWAQHVRWCVAAQAMSCSAPLSGFAALDLREVRLAALGVEEGRVVLSVGGTCGGRGVPPRRFTTEAGRPLLPPDDVQLLRDWCALGTPLLLHVAHDGQWRLGGPVPMDLGPLVPAARAEARGTCT